MSYKVIQCSYDLLPLELRDPFLLSNNGCGRDNASYILIYMDDKLAQIESDAMEPEDAIFCRDLSWITEALEDAYKKGLEDGNSLCSSSRNK